MQIRFVMPPASNRPSLLRKLVTLLITFAIVVVVLMLSVVLFAVIAVLALLAWSYAWWKMRALRKQMQHGFEQDRSRMHEQNSSDKDVFEGEVIRVVDSR